MCFWVVIPVPAHAAKTETYIQCSINLSTWEVLSSVVRNDVGLLSSSLEVRRVDSSKLAEIAQNTSTMDSGISALKDIAGYLEEQNQKVNKITDSNSKNRILSFPGDKISSTSADYDRALAVNNALIFDLNQAFQLYLNNNNIRKTSDVNAFHTAMVDFLTYTQSQIDASDKDYITMQDKNGITYRYRYRIYKGYIGAGLDESLHQALSGTDAEYVNWAILAFEGFNNYSLSGDEAVTAESVYSAEPSQLERTLVGILSGILDGIRGYFGLWTPDEILFNTGARENGYIGGIFPKNWEPTVWAIFIVMEVLAAMILLVGIANNVYKKALSTVNVRLRLEAMRQVQDVIGCAIVLALLPMALRILISMSGSFTDMVSAMLPLDASGNSKMMRDLVIGYGAGTKSIAGILIQFLYFGIEVYFNFFYAIRALVIAILIMIAPIAVAMITVSDTRKQTTVMWAKELLANILIQPIQAFIMVIILILPSSSHGFDNFIALYAMIPITSIIRGMFFGPSGSWVEQAAQKARGKFTGAVAGGTVAIGATAVSGAAAVWGHKKKDDSKKDDKDEQNSEKESRSTGNDLSQGRPYEQPDSMFEQASNADTASTFLGFIGNKIITGNSTTDEKSFFDSVKQNITGTVQGAASGMKQKIAEHPPTVAGVAKATKTVGAIAAGSALAGAGAALGGAGVSPAAAMAITGLGRNLAQSVGYKDKERSKDTNNGNDADYEEQLQTSRSEAPETITESEPEQEQTAEPSGNETMDYPSALRDNFLNKKSFIAQNYSSPEALGAAFQNKANNIYVQGNAAFDNGSKTYTMDDNDLAAVSTKIRHNKADGTKTVQYQNLEKLPEADRANLRTIASMWNSNNSDDRVWLQNQGIEDVSCTTRVSKDGNENLSAVNMKIHPSKIEDNFSMKYETDYDKTTKTSSGSLITETPYVVPPVSEKINENTTVLKDAMSYLKNNEADITEDGSYYRVALSAAQVQNFATHAVGRDGETPLIKKMGSHEKGVTSYREKEETVKFKVPKEELIYSSVRGPMTPMMQDIVKAKNAASLDEDLRKFEQEF